MKRNWKGVCKIGETSGALMLALATIDLEKEAGIRLLQAFPECFAEGGSEGAVPWSAVKEIAAKRRDCQNVFSDEDAQELGIPVLNFVEGRALLPGELRMPQDEEMPSDLNLGNSFCFGSEHKIISGYSFLWQGKLLFAIALHSYRGDENILQAVPMSCIDFAK